MRIKRNTLGSPLFRLTKSRLRCWYENNFIYWLCVKLVTISSYANSKNKMYLMLENIFQWKQNESVRWIIMIRMLELVTAGSDFPLCHYEVWPSERKLNSWHICNSFYVVFFVHWKDSKQDLRTQFLVT